MSNPTQSKRSARERSERIREARQRMDDGARLARHYGRDKVTA